MADVIALTAEGVNEYFPNVSIDHYRYIVPSMDRSRVVLVVAYACLFLIGAISNFYVACVLARILRFKSAETPRAIRIFVFALCCCDLSVLAFLPFLIFDLIYNQWVVTHSSLLCQLYLCSESVNKFCGPFLLVAMSAFCYLKICRPTASHSFRQTSVLADGSSAGAVSGPYLPVPTIVVLICVALAFVLATPVYVYGDLYYLVVHNGSNVRLIMAKCAFHPPDNVLTIFTIYCFICGYVIPATSFTVFYLAVVFHVKRQTPLVLSLRATVGQENRATGSTVLRRVERDGRSGRLERATRTCVGLIVFFLGCWTPYWTMNLKNYFLVPIDETDGTYHPSDMDAVAGYLIHLLPYINCAGYPILHAILNRNIRRDCKRMKDKRKRRRGQQMAMENDHRSGGQVTTHLCSATQNG